MNAYIKAMRLGRWPRSLAVFAGSTSFFFLNRDFLTSENLYWVLERFLFIFFLTWAISTANYIVNEIVDAPFDIHHPTKRHRPYASGEIKKIPFIGLGVALPLASLVPAFIFFSRPFFFSLLTLFAAGFVYNMKPLRTKDIPFLDSISESANNPIRFFIGWFAFSPAGLFPPVSLVVSWWAFGNFLMIAKRLSEFRFLKEKAGNYRASLKRYSKRSLVLGMTASTVLFFILYFAFASVFKLQSFFYISPFVFVYFLLFFWKTLQEKEVMEEPEKLFTHPKFALYTLFLIILFFLSVFLDKPGQ